MRSALPAALLLALPALAACTQNATTDTSTAGGTGTIDVTATDTACEVSSDSAPAGTLTFQVTNGGSKVNEFYLYSADGKRIVGEVENIGPGLQSKLIVTAEQGAYLTACKPGMSGKGIRAGFTVHEPASGSAAPSTDQVLVSKAQNQYRLWVQRQADTLVSRTRQFVTAYAGGRDDVARSLYPQARTYWESIETVAESFGQLDPRTDAREADLRPGQKWTGWHRIEKDLWPQRDPSYTPLSAHQRQVYGDDLLDNVTTIRDGIGELTFTTDQIANGSSGLMEEVATSKVTGEEEYWSHTDLWDFAANVKGARVGYEDVRPILLGRDRALARTLDARFATIDRLLRQQRAGDGYRPYTDLGHTEVKRLADAVNALAEPLSHLTAAVLP
ncbi:MAG: iron uptake system component EfeO [Nocardioidaceae bacterium]|jgi:iron uptake system component EfeO|nr:iron uptake system component EfeO [Nocardioidaceae bacterium]